MARFRFHKGSLADSLATEIQVDSLVRYRGTGGKKEVSLANTTARTTGLMAIPTHISLPGYTSDGEFR